MNKQERISTYPLNSIVVAGYSYRRVAFYQVVGHHKRNGSPILREIQTVYTRHSFDPVHSQTIYEPVPDAFVEDTLGRIQVHADHLRLFDATKPSYDGSKTIYAHTWSGEPIIVHTACD